MILCMEKRAQCERVQSKWPRACREGTGAPVASAGLKHGAPRDLVEGRAKLSIQSRQRGSSPANLTSAHDAGTTGPFEHVAGGSPLVSVPTALFPLFSAIEPGARSRSFFSC